MTFQSAVNGEDSFRRDGVLQTNEHDQDYKCWLCGGNIHASLKYCTSCGKEMKTGHVESNPGLVENYRRHSRSYIRDLSFARCRKSYDSQRACRKVLINTVVSVLLIACAAAGIQHFPGISTTRDAVLAALSTDGLKDNSYATATTQEPAYSAYEPVSYKQETGPQYRY